MSTLYIDRKDLTLKLDSHCLALYENGEKKATVPFHLLERVVLRGNVQLESRLLCAFGEHKIDVLLLSGRNSQRRSMAFSHSHGDVRRRLGQYQACLAPAIQLPLANNLVLRKVRKQRRLLGKAMQQRADLRKPLFSANSTLDAILDKLKADDCAPLSELRGLEGAAAAAYFSGYTRLFPASLDFQRRRKRPPPDPVNACLSLGYTLLHFDAVQVCHIVGLDPMLGFYHEPAFGRESLACDLIEPVRAYLDELVWDLFADHWLRRDHFTADGNRCLLNKAGRKIFYAQYEAFARPVRRLLRRYAQNLATGYLQADRELPL